MVDPLRPTLMTRLRAGLGGEQNARALEALRQAGKAAYHEAMLADQLREELAAGGTPLWHAPTVAGSQLLAAWNAMALQTLGETLLDAAYAANPRTVGYVPRETFGQAWSWLSGVDAWLIRARQARGRSRYDVTAELELPAVLAVGRAAVGCSPEHRDSMIEAATALRRHAELAQFGLERHAPHEAQPVVDEVQRLVGMAAGEIDYVTALRQAHDDDRLRVLIDRKIRTALGLWFHAGQLAAMPRLHGQVLRRARALAPSSDGARPGPGSASDGARPGRGPTGAAQRPSVPVPGPRPPVPRSGGAGFDPWCLTDPVTLEFWRRDPQAARAIDDLWQSDPDPAATLAVQAEIDVALAFGSIVRYRTPVGATCFYTCPWSALYEVRRPVRIGGRGMRMLQQFVYDVGPRRLPGGATHFRRAIVVGPFTPADDDRAVWPGFDP